MDNEFSHWQDASVSDIVITQTTNQIQWMLLRVQAKLDGKICGPEGEQFQTVEELKGAIGCLNNARYGIALGTMVVTLLTGQELMLWKGHNSMAIHIGKILADAEKAWLGLHPDREAQTQGIGDSGDDINDQATDL
ncbi:hypothetical protein BDZ91DRAFT_785024 [Kalaharituber pfeilii]|nr:hypothetical protein BDZ91DRAFT_785024 [Kalaharituber pfeilii]